MLIGLSELDLFLSKGLEVALLGVATTRIGLSSLSGRGGVITMLLFLVR